MESAALILYTCAKGLGWELDESKGCCLRALRVVSVRW
jgi:hypothetical protein